MKLSWFEKIGARAEDFQFVTVKENRNGIKEIYYNADEQDVSFTNMSEVGQYAMKTKEWIDDLIEDEIVQDAINQLAQDGDKMAVAIMKEYDTIDFEGEAKPKPKSRSSKKKVEDDKTAIILKKKALGSDGDQDSLDAYIDTVAKGDGHLATTLRVLKKHAIGEDGDEESFEGYVEYILHQRKKSTKKAAGKKKTPKKKAVKAKKGKAATKNKKFVRKSTPAAEDSDEDEDDSIVPDFKLYDYNVSNVFDRNINYEDPNARDQEHEDKDDLQLKKLDVRKMFDPKRNYCMDAAVENIHANPVDDFESLVDEE